LDVGVLDHLSPEGELRLDEVAQLFGRRGESFELDILESGLNLWTVDDRAQRALELGYDLRRRAGRRDRRLMASPAPRTSSGNRLTTASGDLLSRNPIAGRVACCACAASGHPAAAPPTIVMNSRRLTGRPLKQRVLPYHAVRCTVDHGKFWLPMSALGQKRTSRDIRGMSALPPKADIG